LCRFQITIYSSNSDHEAEVEVDVARNVPPGQERAVTVRGGESGKADAADMESCSSAKWAEMWESGVNPPAVPLPQNRLPLGNGEPAQTRGPTEVLISSSIRLLHCLRRRSDDVNMRRLTLFSYVLCLLFDMNLHSWR
jgi:hypothetical protein